MKTVGKTVFVATAIFSLSHLSLKADQASYNLFPGRIDVPRDHGSPLFTNSRLGSPGLSPNDLGKIFEAVQKKGREIGREKFLYWDTCRIHWPWGQDSSYVSVKLIGDNSDFAKAGDLMIERGRKGITWRAPLGERTWLPRRYEVRATAIVTPQGWFTYFYQGEWRGGLRGYQKTDLVVPNATLWCRRVHGTGVGAVQEGQAMLSQTFASNLFRPILARVARLSARLLVR